MYLEKDFIKAISESFKKYIQHGSRSTEKLKPIHKFVAQTLKKYYNKEIDIACYQR